MKVTIKDRIVAHRSAPDVYDPPSFEQMAARIEELEAKLVKAIGDLGRLSRDEVFGDGGAWGMRLSEDALGREILARMKFARTTLAELTGGKDDGNP